ncbi:MULTISPECIES: choline dehydrogenase [Caballeronia]|jgi:choline dehydrogenase|uniref:Choline dehydrogenase n=1 Tax=Caballeronia zhejiangensis TaxID=871203 RepID=A0A656QVS4_9BURK|nr:MULTISPECIES: choline dehydrogenase [Caballeronia]KDR33692.1 choline dehydrogenase [Caballeronia zhejiangensis]MCG7403449.1 choline dehydrogenase [Caballeronia zhejiangensis]MCI1045722.1 choline dehydrogenase [Caballeronia zhejiangensis]MDR5788549.1 choline dehydrogenase [Caballeronia sp. LP003]
MQQEVDYVIVGAGSAGCVLANRLSADPSNTVLLLEAGGPDASPWIHIPVGYFKTMHDPELDWCYRTEPDDAVAGRSIDWPRGKVLGGCSSLNGLLYVRGQREDYDRWAELGNAGWSYKDVLPYFRKSEDQEHGASEYHGAGGPLKVSDLRLRRPIADHFIAAAQEIGIPFNEDYNGATQEGVGYFQQTAYKGFRWSTAKGFLKPVRDRRNLIVETRAQTRRVLFNGKEAVGIEYMHEGVVKKVRARVEVILAAGAIGSPQILQNSGVGPSSVLNGAGVQVRHDLPGVGRNLQDHLQVRLVFKTRERTLNDEVNNPLKKALIGLQYVISRTGPLTLAASQVAIFTRSSPDVARPDIQFHMQPLSADKPGQGAHPFSAFTSSVCQLRPYSRGSVEIRSNDPLQYPAIHANYLSDERDHPVVIGGIKVARRIAAAPSLAKHIVSEFIPGSEYRTDADLLDVARKFSQSIYHPAGTCKMGNDASAVVDERLKVRGIGRLRVVDASIMPELVSGNTNAPVIMIAEKAADMILEDQRYQHVTHVEDVTQVVAEKPMAHAGQRD